MSKLSVFQKGLISIACAFLAALGVTPSTLAQDLRPTDLSTDEAGLWYFMDKYEEAVKTSGTVIRDPELQAYTEEILCNLIGDQCKDLRIYIQDVPSFNATMAPNGMMSVYSGLMLRTESEAQLACVIGHEYGHYIEKHSLQGHRRAKKYNNITLALTFAIAAAGGSSDAVRAVNEIATLLFYHYSREQENEADVIGFDLINNAGYRSDECSYVWKNVIEEQESSSFRRVRKSANRSSPFSTHPLSSNRVKTLEGLAERYPAATNMGTDRHQRILKPYLGQWIEAELRAKDFDRTLYLLDRMNATGFEPGLVNYYIAEAHRLRKGEGDRATAVEYWEKASAQTGSPPQVWRALGEHYRKKKRKDDALMAYRKYLSLAPMAEDRELIQAYVARLEMK